MRIFFTYVKSALLSLLIFLFLVIITNWICGLYLDRMGGEKRHLLPSYMNEEGYAEDIFNDYHSVSHRYQPFTEWQMLPYSGKTLHVNANGLREHSAPPGASPTPVIRFFGGSTMWGEGADDAHTIPALVHQALNTGTLVNHAQLAYNSRQNLDALISLYAQGEKADIVIFYDGVNDAAFLCPREIEDLPGHRLIPLFQKKVFGGSRQLMITALDNLFTENILLVIQHYQSKRTDRPLHYNCLDHEKGVTIARMIMKNWEMANELVTSRGGKFIAILQPVAYIGSPQVDHLELDEELGQNIKLVYSELQRLKQEANYSWLYDFTEALSGREYIYIDFCHVTKTGNKIIADKLSEIIYPQLVQ